ncbi:MAG: pseudouridine synthase [Planctomycetes bacterium]|nr:pseudouridine synthase [Planctomycetota bacterium]
MSTYGDPQGALRILHDDATLVAVSKPGGLIVHRTAESNDRRFLLQELGRQLGTFLYPVHRLDRAASGVMVFGRDSASARALQEALAAEDARKEYLVLVRSSTPESWTSVRPLSKRRTRGARRAAHGRPKDVPVRQEASTSFVKVGEFSRCSLLKARLHTGRRHQIRRHLAHEAHQVLGDTTYGKGKINHFFRAQYGLPRLFLHACLLEFRHPKTATLIRLDDPLAPDLREFLGRLPDCPEEILRSL